MNLLHSNTPLLSLGMQSFERIMTSINNLIIFVNKAMKDGFILKEASCTRHGDLELSMGDTSVYLRLLWNGVSLNPFKAGIHFHDRLSSPWDGPWAEYRGTMKLHEIIKLCDEKDIRFGLGFVLSAAKSEQLQELEKCWSHRQFPSCEIPLQDWQIVENLVSQNLADRLDNGQESYLSNFRTLQGSRETDLMSFLHCSHQDRSLRWRSVILNGHRPYPPIVMYNKQVFIIEEL